MRKIRFNQLSDFLALALALCGKYEIECDGDRVTIKVCGMWWNTIYAETFQIDLFSEFPEDETLAQDLRSTLTRLSA